MPAVHPVDQMRREGDNAVEDGLSQGVGYAQLPNNISTSTMA